MCILSVAFIDLYATHPFSHIGQPTSMIKRSSIHTEEREREKKLLTCVFIRNECDRVHRIRIRYLFGLS